MNERNAFSLPGIPMALLDIAAWLLLVFWLSTSVREPSPGNIVFFGPVAAILLFVSKGFFQVQPNQGQVMQLFGRYAGTVRDEGLRWTNPFYAKRAVSLRVRNF